VQKATGRAEAIAAGRQQNKKRYLIIQLMKKKDVLSAHCNQMSSKYPENYR